MAGVTRKRFNELLEASGVGWTERKIITGAWEAQTSGGNVMPVETAIPFFEYHADRLDRETVPMPTIAATGGYGITPIGRSSEIPNQGYNPELAVVLRDISATLQELRVAERLERAAASLERAAEQSSLGPSRQADMLD